jgi:Mrp family chromosome partitioning ATPase
MTDQSKIPLPEGRESLIERAVESFGWRGFAAPPVPANLRSAEPRAEPEAGRPEQPRPDAQHGAAQSRSPAERPVPDAHRDEGEAALPARQAVQAADIEPAPPALPRLPGAAHAIDRDHLRGQGFIVPEGSVTQTIEEFRIVKRQLLLQVADLLRMGGSAAAQRVLICSPHPEDGKTFCAINLALAIAAERESEVLLVDADFAKPSVLTALGISGGRGLMDALADPLLDVADLVLATDVPGLKVLPAGDATNRDSEYLASSRTATVLDRLTQGAPNRVVIFDSPPVLAASPAAELAKYVGQTLVVCRADRTGQQSLEDAISLLSGCPNIQLLLNAVSFSPSGRRFGAYYGYGA